MHNVRSHLITGLTWLFFLLCAYALVSVGVMTWRGYTGRLDMQAEVVGFLLLFVAILVGWGVRDRILIGLQGWTEHPMPLTNHQSRHGWLSLVLPGLVLPGLVLAGLVLRLFFHYLYPATPGSDEAVYLQLAHGLLEHGELSVDGYLSFWPPGYPLLLTPLLWMAGVMGMSDHFMVLLLNTLLYLVGAALCWRIAANASGVTGGLLATALYVLWPNHIAMFGQVGKEAVLIVLVMLVVWQWLQVFDASDFWVRARRMLLIGVLLGMTALVQPSMQLALTALLLSGWLLGRSLSGTLVDAAWILLGLALVMGPWSVRNASVHGEFLLLTSNGGVILNMSNRDGVEGTWNREGALELQALPELEANRVGYEQAIAWIKDNPADFATLVWKRQLSWLGNDGHALSGPMLGASFAQAEAIERARITSREYQLARVWANAYWAGIWWLMLVALMGRVTVSKSVRPAFVLIGLLTFYVLSVHSVFESGSKYHVLLTGLLSVLAATLLVSTGQRTTKLGHLNSFQNS